MFLAYQGAFAQTDSVLPVFNAADSLELERIDSIYTDSFTVMQHDTLYYEKFIPYDKTIWRNSKINLRKSLTASRNPPVRKNLNNQLVFIWAILILLLILTFKSSHPLQYRLLNKSWYSAISFNEFFSAQTSVFKYSRLLTWFIISQIVSMGVYITIRSGKSADEWSDSELIAIISSGVILIYAANQVLKNVFAYSFYQPSLSRDYAIIFRINSYAFSLILLPALLLIYYNSSENLRYISLGVMILFLLGVYVSSLVKFIFTGRFLQNQSNFILFLYLCAFEILPLLVLMKSINTFLEYD